MTEKIRVMVAEDMPLLREDFCDIIERAEDMEIVGAAASGQEICALSEKNPCDVILMDIEMETMRDGITAAEHIHKNNPEIKIIFLTVHETDDIITDSMASGAVDYIVKGCDDKAILDHIRDAYTNETALAPRIRQTIMREYKRLHQSEQSLLFFIHNVAKLTPVERELVKLLLRGLKISEIAKERYVEVSTVKTQIRSLLGKFGCFRTKEIVEMVQRLGLEHLFA